MVLDLGGGRRRKDETVDLQVGATVHKLVGEAVRTGEVVLTIRSRVAIGAEQIGERCRAIIGISASSTDASTLFLE
jgi:thymidine phosphorylase